MKYLLTICVLVLTIQQYQAQNGLNDVVLDLLTISDRYVKPGAEAAIHQSTAGWFNSAKPMGKWEVDFSLHGNVIFLPEDRKTTVISNSELRNLRLQDGSNSAFIPTALGGDTPIFFDGELFDQEFEFQTLEGLNEDEFYYGFIQASVGLPYETQLTLRYAPPIDINDVDYLVYGVGLQHGINQYFKNPSAIDMAFQATYSYFNFDINFDPLEIPGVTLNNVRVISNSFLFQYIVSKRFHHFEPIAGIGLSTSSFSYELGGNGETLLGVLNTALETLEDSESRIKGHLGLNAYFGKFNIQVVSTFGNFINTNLGLHYQFN